MKRILHIGVILGVFLIATGVVCAKGFFKVGEEAPTFSLTSINGDTVSLGDLRGKVVVLGLFHICEPCMIQGTNLQKVYEATQGKNVAVVGVNSAGDSKGAVKEFLSQFPVRVTYPYLLDPNQITDRLYGGGRFIPNVYIIDQHGVIQWQRVGNMDLADHSQIVEQVERLLEKSGDHTPNRL